MFTTLHANSGYWQCKGDESDGDKTTSLSQMRLLRYFRIPLGLKSAPAIFQTAALDIILSRVKWHFALVYLDDVIIYF